MLWSVEWPSVSASRSHLGSKAMSRQNGTKELDISSAMKQSETENQKV